jgi:histidinol-phosphatase (PHP family)
MRFGSRISLHTHTRRCKHASGLPVDYCAEAVRQGMSVLGFSDHAPFPDGRYGGSRMDFSELDAYCADIEAARAAYPGLVVLKGFEVDYFPSEGIAFYEDTFLARCGADFLIAGTHFLEPFDPAFNQWHDANRFDASAVRRHVESHIRALETGLFDYLAHPDTFARCCPYWTPELRAVCGELVDAAIAMNVPLELNAYGLRKPPMQMPEGPRAQYPWRPFWELAAEKGAQVVVGADAHRPEDVWGNSDDLLAFAADLGLTVENDRVAAAIRRRCGR